MIIIHNETKYEQRTVLSDLIRFLKKHKVIAPENKHLNYFVERAERRIMKHKQNASTKYFD